MPIRLFWEAERYGKLNRHRHIWKRIVNALACIVVFCTTYALILPAITVETTYICGIEEHIHTQDCYATDGATLVCELSEHTHSEQCQPVTELTEEESARVAAVISQIDALPAAAEIEKTVQELEATGAYTQEETYLTQTYTAVNQAYTDYSALDSRLQPKVTNALKLMELEYIWSASAYDEAEDSSVIGERLDGDFAYISNVRTVSCSTGTNLDETEGPGKDISDEDMILRTFDTATYTFEFQTDIRNEANVAGYRTGKLYFEFILPYDQEQVVFDTKNTLWLQTAQEIKYETVIVENVGQVLRGSFLLVPNNENPNAIGQSLNELTIAIRVLRMNNADVVAPRLTLWLEHNQVGTEYENGIPTTIVTGTTPTCSTQGHGTESKTLELPEITVSAAPKYNIVLRAPNDSRGGVFDFSTGNENAPNKEFGNVTGRIGVMGVMLEVNGGEKGMVGVQLPSEEHPITFTLTLSSVFKPSTGTTRAEIDAKYQPIFYSGSGNIYGDTDTDHRPASQYGGYCPLIPYNKMDGDRAKTHESCADGGVWSFTQNPENRNEIQVTITDFVFDTTQLPHGPAESTVNNTTYYNPETISNWWEIGRAVFSAGEIWTVQPYYSLDTDKQYIVDAYGVEGQFEVTAAVSDLSMYAENGVEVTTQTSTDDDSRTYAEYLRNPGNISGSIAYRRQPRQNYNDALTDGCFTTDEDWATPETRLDIFSMTNCRNCTEEYRPVAIDQLLKWDDEFFEPDRAATSNAYYFGEIVDGEGWEPLYNILWGAKADGTGWTDDEEMKQATVDDLVWYSSLDDLKRDGKIPLAALQEGRGLKIERASNIMFYVIGTIKKSCPSNQVYMTVRNGYMWRQSDVQTRVEAYYAAAGKPASELTDQDYVTYMQSVFPSKANNDKAMLDENGDFNADYPVPTWRQDYWRTNHTGDLSITSIEQTDSTAVKNAAKPTYDEEGYHPGKGMRYYQDSCLVIPYKSTITKKTAQYESSAPDKPKETYDMNQNQRVVDFVLTPTIEYGSGYAGWETVAYITDTLPAGLTYIPGSAYLDGTYTQDPLHRTQGIVEGGIQETTTAPDSGYYLKQESITENPDGTTTIKWLFPLKLDENAAKWTENIYYSCKIGTPGDEDTDVKNLDTLTNTVTIWTEGEAVRAFELSYGNMAQSSIKISKTGALSLVKLADQLLVNLWDPIGFTLNVGNNSGTPKQNVVIVESLPYNGKNNTSFSGSLVLTEFSAGTVKSKESSEQLLGNFRFYYTRDFQYAGLLSEDLIEQGVDFATSAEWIPLKMSTQENTTEGRPYGLFETEDGKAFPADVDQTSQIVAIVAVGDLPGSSTLKMHVTMELEGGQASDVLVNYLSQDSLVSYAKTSVVNRILEGLAWMDDNLNNARDNGENLLNGVKVSLLKLVGGSYIPVCYPDTETPVVIDTGQMVDIQSSPGNILPHETGYYRFTGLDEGTYAVKFTSGSHDISKYVVCRQNYVMDDSLDSDAVATYGPGTEGLLSAQISGIEMKPAKELTTGTGESLHHDIGFIFVNYELPATGGTGTAPYILGGAFLTILAIGLLLYSTIPKRRKEVANTS